MSLTADQLVRLGFQSVAEFVKATAANIAELTGGGATTLHSHAGGGAATVVSADVTFTENGEGTYTGTVAIPSGATVTDVIWRNTALWTAATSATLDVGDDDDSDGWFTGVDVKTEPPADVNGAGGASFRFAGGGGGGAYSNNTGTLSGTYGSGKYCATAKTLTATVVTVGAGTAGRSRLLVTYALSTPTVAVKS